MKTKFNEFLNEKISYSEFQTMMEYFNSLIKESSSIMIRYFGNDDFKFEYCCFYKKQFVDGYLLSYRYDIKTHRTLPTEDEYESGIMRNFILKLNDKEICKIEFVDDDNFEFKFLTNRYEENINKVLRKSIIKNFEKYFNLIDEYEDDDYNYYLFSTKLNFNI